MHQYQVVLERSGSLVLARIEVFDVSLSKWTPVQYVVRDNNGIWERFFEMGDKPARALAAAKEFMREMAASK